MHECVHGCALSMSILSHMYIFVCVYYHVSCVVIISLSMCSSCLHVCVDVCRYGCVSLWMCVFVDICNSKSVCDNVHGYLFVRTMYFV